jgi:cell division control protein 24
MEVALHSGLARAHTSQAAPTTHSRYNSASGPSPLMHTQSHQSYASQYSNWSHSTARDTQSSAATSTSTLFTPPVFPTSMSVNGGPIEASDNVLNRRADKDTSLFQICLNLQTRLRKVPNFGHWLVAETADADDDTDPVTILWRTFRRGYPLMDIYNALNPKDPLVVDESRIPEKKRGQAATFKFIQACMNEFKFPAAECFIITDLYGDDTTGFVKV